MTRWVWLDREPVPAESGTSMWAYCFECGKMKNKDTGECVELEMLTFTEAVKQSAEDKNDG